MAIPTDRTELAEQMTSAFEKLWAEVERLDEASSRRICVDDWTIKDLLAVRVWWAERVSDWIAEGRRGGKPVTPAQGYKWSETPRLNADIIRAEKVTPLDALRRRLKHGYERALETLDALDNRELLERGVFPWAGKLPLLRYLSINTARQYTTARSYIRRAAREGAGGMPQDR